MGNFIVCHRNKPTRTAEVWQCTRMLIVYYMNLYWVVFWQIFQWSKMFHNFIFSKAIYNSKYLFLKCMFPSRINFVYMLLILSSKTTVAHSIIWVCVLGLFTINPQTANISDKYFNSDHKLFSAYLKTCRNSSILSFGFAMIYRAALITKGC